MYIYSAEMCFDEIIIGTSGNHNAHRKLKLHEFEHIMNTYTYTSKLININIQYINYKKEL